MDPIYYSTLNLTFTSQLSHHIFTSEKREEREREENLKHQWRSRCIDRRPAEIEVTERTKRVEIGVHHAALPRLSPQNHSSSSPPTNQVRWACSSFSLFFFFFFFFFHIFLFWFNFFVRIGFYFVFCVWIMWDVFWEWTKETKTKIRRFLISFYFYSNSLPVDIVFSDQK